MSLHDRQPTRLSMDAVRFRTFLFTLPRHFHRPPPPRRAASSPLSPPTLRRRTDNASIPDAPTLRFYPVARFIDSSPSSRPTPADATTRGFLAIFTADAPTSHRQRNRQRIDSRRPDAPFLSRRPVHRFLNSDALASRRPYAPLNTARSTPTLRRRDAPTPRSTLPARHRRSDVETPLGPAQHCPLNTDAPTSSTPPADAPTPPSFSRRSAHRHRRSDVQTPTTPSPCLHANIDSRRSVLPSLRHPTPARPTDTARSTLCPPTVAYTPPTPAIRHSHTSDHAQTPYFRPPSSTPPTPARLSPSVTTV